MAYNQEPTIFSVEFKGALDCTDGAGVVAYYLREPYHISSQRSEDQVMIMLAKVEGTGEEVLHRNLMTVVERGLDAEPTQELIVADNLNGSVLAEVAAAPALALRSLLNGIEARQEYMERAGLV